MAKVPKYEERREGQREGGKSVSLIVNAVLKNVIFCFMRIIPLTLNLAFSELQTSAS